MAGRPLFFYAQWPLGFYNPEGERKAIALAEAGYDVHYVVSVGLRNPGWGTLGKGVRVAARKLGRREGTGVASRSGIATDAILLAPPRQLPLVRAANVAWVRWQLESMVDWAETLAWIRYPSPEVVAALRELKPAAVVYECVDAHDQTPGVQGGWKERFRRGEQELVDLADLVVVPSEALADRLRSMGADVRVIPHGVDASRFTVRGPDRRGSGPTVAGYVGTIDPRLDTAALRTAAERHPQWEFRLFGPIRDGYDVSPLTQLPNVSIGAPVPNEALAGVIAGFDVGLMPYLDALNFEYMCPVKNLEFMAAGKPAVARPNRALLEYIDLLYFAETPEAFSEQLDRALEEDTPELAHRRRAVAEANTWDRRLREVEQTAIDLAAP